MVLLGTALAWLVATLAILEATNVSIASSCHLRSCSACWSAR
jgi:hypothetical protein